MAGDPRKFHCWNCGSPEHKLSECAKPVRQENKNFWRKYFRLHDSHERERHQKRYMDFLLRFVTDHDTLEPSLDFQFMTKEEANDLLNVKHLEWIKKQWEAKQASTNEELQDNSDDSTTNSQVMTEPASPGSSINFTDESSASTCSSILTDESTASASSSINLTDESTASGSSGNNLTDESTDTSTSSRNSLADEFTASASSSSYDVTNDLFMKMEIDPIVSGNDGVGETEAVPGGNES